MKPQQHVVHVPEYIQALCHSLKWKALKFWFFLTQSTVGRSYTPTLNWVLNLVGGQKSPHANYMHLCFCRTLLQVEFCIVVKWCGQAFAMAYVPSLMDNPVSIFGASSVKCSCSVNARAFCISPFSFSLGVCVLHDFEKCSAAGSPLSLYVDD